MGFIMLQTIKKIVPKPVKRSLIVFKKKTYDHWQKKRLFERMQLKHSELLQQVKRKDKIKVVFLTIHKSMWKLDPVFQKMLKDPLFDPQILVCPYTDYGDERMLEDIELTYSYFIEKGYAVSKSLNDDGSWVKLKTIEPDIVFFTSPHDLTRKEYYENAYLNYLSCYVPYFFLTTTHGNDQTIYNQYFHNAMWKIFMPHEYSMKKAKQISASKARNCMLSGYPFCEALVKQDRLLNHVWKEQFSKKKIIFAPHHTIEKGELELSNFLIVAELMLELAVKYKDKVQWSFKPHPILKTKLYLHPEWGNEKTDDYYHFWDSHEFTQLDEGEYIDLFIQSDSIIHDCGSFIAEYPFIGKPCAYLQMNGQSQLNSINGFGRYALKSYTRINCENDLISFIEYIVSGKVQINSAHRSFISDHVNPLYKCKQPSEIILNYLTNTLNGKIEDEKSLRRNEC